ncbi:hypothetical protein HOA92_00125 [archaeon]|jgi:hypothetical protein|nr:hypothetical protein [archaeon]MBT6761426.1 hypothetical protein [archaeon]
MTLNKLTGLLGSVSSNLTELVALFPPTVIGREYQFIPMSKRRGFFKLEPFLSTREPSNYSDLFGGQQIPQAGESVYLTFAPKNGDVYSVKAPDTYQIIHPSPSYARLFDRVEPGHAIAGLPEDDPEMLDCFNAVTYRFQTEGRKLTIYGPNTSQEGVGGNRVKYKSILSVLYDVHNLFTKELGLTATPDDDSFHRSFRYEK